MLRAGKHRNIMGQAVAVDLGATRTRVAIIGEEGQIGERREARTPAKESDPSRLAGFLSALISEVRAGHQEESLSGIGLSVAGPVDITRGVLVNPPNMAFRDVPLREELSRIFHCPVRMVNDCHAGVLGEMHYGKGQGKQDVVYVTISTGIGGGVVSGGRLLLGRKGNAAEIGHFLVDNTYGSLRNGAGSMQSRTGGLIRQRRSLHQPVRGTMTCSVLSGSSPGSMPGASRMSLSRTTRRSSFLMGLSCNPMPISSSRTCGSSSTGSFPSLRSSCQSLEEMRLSSGQRSSREGTRQALGISDQQADAPVRNLILCRSG